MEHEHFRASFVSRPLAVKTKPPVSRVVVYLLEKILVRRNLLVEKL